MNLKKWSKRYRYPIILSFCTLMLFTIYFNVTRTSCTYNINGSLKVLSRIPEFENEEVALSETPTRISASSNSITWNEWDEVTTDENGYFEVEQTKKGRACNGRYIKAEIKFKDEELSIRTSLTGTASWYKVGTIKKSKCDSSDDCEFGELIFEEDGDNDLDDGDAKDHADLWWIYKWALNYLDDKGYGALPEDESLDIVYPYNTIVPDTVEMSYVNPITKTINLYFHYDEDDEDNKNNYDALERTEKTLFHEFGHVWAFHHSQNEIRMAKYLLTNKSTHGVVGKEAVAFHEGLGKLFGSSLFSALLEEKGKSDDDSPLYNLSYNKTFLSEEQYDDSEPKEYQGQLGEYGTECVHHDTGHIGCMDHGWFSILNGLTISDRDDPFLSEADFVDYDIINSDGASDHIVATYKDYDKGSCHTDRPELSFFDILDVFYETDDFAEMDTEQITIDYFFERLQKIKDLDEDTMIYYKDSWDLGTDAEPYFLYCDNALLIKKIDAAYTKPEYYWVTPSDDDSIFYKEGINVTFVNASDGDTAPSSYIKTSREYTGGPLKTSISLSSMEVGSELYDLSIPKNENESFPATTITWRTLVLKKGTNEEWYTNERSITFGADYEADVYEVSLISIPDTAEGSSTTSKSTESLTKSSSSSTKSKGITSTHSSSDDSASLIDTIYESTKTYYVYCGAINQGNVSPRVTSSVGVYIEDELYQEEEISALSPGDSKYILFEIDYDSLNDEFKFEDSEEDISVDCRVDIYEEIEETSENNNTLSEVLIEGEDGEESILDQLISSSDKGNIQESYDLVWEEFLEGQDIQSAISASLEDDNSHEYIGRLKGLENMIYNLITTHYFRNISFEISDTIYSDWKGQNTEYFSSDDFIDSSSRYLEGEITPKEMETIIRAGVYQ